MSFRVGLGFDLHPFAAAGSGRRLMLGGVAIPDSEGLAGHSDADVLLHAICDAVLGAIGGGDLGRHFPDDDPALAGVSSTILLEKVTAQARRRGYRVVNLDAVLIAQRPKLAPHLPAMGRHIAAILQVEESATNVKATSPEGLSSLGREEGIAAQAMVLLSKD